MFILRLLFDKDVFQWTFSLCKTRLSHVTPCHIPPFPRLISVNHSRKQTLGHRSCASEKQTGKMGIESRFSSSQSLALSPARNSVFDRRRSGALPGRGRPARQFWAAAAVFLRHRESQPHRRLSGGRTERGSRKRGLRHHVTPCESMFSHCWDRFSFDFLRRHACY